MIQMMIRKYLILLFSRSNKKRQRKIDHSYLTETDSPPTHPSRSRSTTLTTNIVSAISSPHIDRLDDHLKDIDTSNGKYFHIKLMIE